MLIEVEFRVVRSLQRSEIGLNTFRSHITLLECIQRFSIRIILVRSMFKSAFYAIYETLIQILAPEEQHVNRNKI